MQTLKSRPYSPEGFVAHLLRTNKALIAALLTAWLAVLCLVLITDWNGPHLPSAQVELGQQLLLIIGVFCALWFNALGRPGVALGTVGTAIFVSTTVLAYSGGHNGPATVLDLYYFPTVLAGMTLNRRGLLITGAATLLVLLSLFVVQENWVHALGFSAATRTTLHFTAMYLMMLLVLHQFVTVARSRLAEAAQREQRMTAAYSAQTVAERERDLERSLNTAIVQNMPGLLIVSDENGQVILHGKQAKQNTSFRSASSAGKAMLRELLPEVDARELNHWMQETLVAGKSTRIFELQDASGNLVPFTIQSSRLEVDQRPLIVSIGLDTSKLVAAQQQIEALNVTLQDRVSRLSSLRRIHQTITSSSDLSLTLDLMLSEAAGSLAVDAGAILLFDAPGNYLRWAADYGISSPDQFRKAHLQLGEGLAGTVGLTREMVYIGNEVDLQRQFRRWPHIAGEGFNSYVAVPLIARGKLQGVLEFFHRASLKVNDDWLDYLNALATQVAIALHNADLLEGMEKANAELLQAYDTTIEGWSRALDLRDEETEGHSRRVTELTLELANRLGSTADELVHMRRGALLHDIGKMGVPDEILRKTGPLTEDEHKLMQQHTSFAHELLSPIRFLQHALDIPYLHHEKWDGTGYPLGLKGEVIPRAARIFALADVYDALTSHRPYRDAWSKEQALEWIESQAGSHFDPVLTQEFINLMRGRKVHADSTHR